jgi:membrane-associated phospholipid phosphatase
VAAVVARSRPALRWIPPDSPVGRSFAISSPRLFVVPLLLLTGIYRASVSARWDRHVVEAFQDLHWGPANWVFVHLSDWWVKSLVLVGIGLVADVVSRRSFPLGGVLAAVSYGVAALLANGLKTVFDRPRPSVGHPEIHPLVAVPHSGSMPSAHAAEAFAAAVAVGLVHPRLRWPLLVLAALIGLSRVWLGVHYLSDVIVGAALGSVIAYVAWRIAAIIAARTSSP